MKKILLNNPKTCVEEAIDGLVLCNPSLKRVSGLNIVVRHDIELVKNNQVTLLTGGGAGHEPAHAGFIGEGMLSGAVIGNVFASPSVSSILAAIRICCGAKGMLLIVKNYTGDRLNFGIAVEKARGEGKLIEMVIVDDDVALPKGKGITGGRGVAGTILVHKIAGAAAQAGDSLASVFHKATQVVNSVASLGVALSVCTVPGTATSTRLSAPDIIEIGMGIHGESGREQVTLPSEGQASFVTDIMLKAIFQSERLANHKEFGAALLINNLGSLSVLELQVMTREILVQCQTLGVNVLRVYSGSFMTALDMQGISLTALVMTEELIRHLDANTSAPAWVKSWPLINDLSTQTIVYDESVYANAEASHQHVIASNASNVAISESAVPLTKKICEAILAVESELSSFDAIAGDGDCGVVMSAGANRILSDISATPNLTSYSTSQYCDFLADSISASMGGTSGVLLEIFFRALKNHFDQSTDTVESESFGSIAHWASAMKQGLSAMQYYGGAELGMRTMLDAFIPAVDSLQTSGDIKAAAAASENGCEQTKEMGGVAGRANYVNESLLQGVPDPGAFAVATAFRAAALFSSE